MSRKNTYARMSVVMDIAALSTSSIKIRSKHATFIVNPIKEIPKTSADAILLLNHDADTSVQRVLDYRVVINGPGEYEIGSVKVSGILIDSGFVYTMFADGLFIILGKASNVSKIKDSNISPCSIAVLNVDDSLSDSSITSLDPKVVVLYGSGKEEGAKTLGKAGTVSIQKFTISKDKLPQETEVVVLGYGEP